MEELIAERMHHVHESLIREILKVVNDPRIISFAGGLPNPDLFPMAEIEEACVRVLREDGKAALQYATTEGYPPLREYIAARYRRTKGLEIDPSEILIVNGSQQGNDLMGKVFLNEGDGLLLERPSYLGAIQSYSVYRPTFLPIPLRDDGVDTASLADTLATSRAKLFYGIPNFQNPTGISYSARNRAEVAEILARHGTLYVEDDPYGELRFAGEEMPSMRHYLGKQAVLLGSFSKIVSPGLRLGWICADREYMKPLVIAKQATDLHANYFAQRVVYEYLIRHDIDAHIARIRNVYKRQRDCMVQMIERYFPPEIAFTRPDGGMFLWLRLPESTSAMELFHRCIEKGVAFVPGRPFYVDDGGDSELRLSYSTTDEATIERGIRAMASAINELFG